MVDLVLRVLHLYERMLRRSIITSFEEYLYPRRNNIESVSTAFEQTSIYFVFATLLLCLFTLFNIGAYLLLLNEIPFYLLKTSLEKDLSLIGIFFLLGLQIFTTRQLFKSYPDNYFFKFLMAPLKYPEMMLASFAHLLLPNKRSRIQEVYEYILANADENENFNRTQRQKKKSALEQKTEELLEEIKNLPAFTEKYFQRSQSLTRFLGENLKNIEGEVSTYLLFFILSIPKRKELSVDALKNIIQSALQHDGSAYVFEQNGLLDFLDKPEFVSEEFREYTEPQLKKLLTNKYTPIEWGQFLSTVLVQKKDTNPDYRFISQVLANVKRTPTSLKLGKINGVKEGLTFKVLENKYDYETARKDFKNCVRSYFDNHNLDIFVVHEGKVPRACVSVDKFLKINEIKAPFNKPVDDDVKRKIQKELEALKAI